MAKQLSDDEIRYRISKLPEPIRKFLALIEGQRDNATTLLNEYLEQQKPSPFFTVDHPLTGEDRGPTRKERYIQTNNMTVVHAGVQLTIFLREGQIELQWSNETQELADVAFIPTAFQCAMIVHPLNMK